MLLMQWFSNALVCESFYQGLKTKQWITSPAITITSHFRAISIPPGPSLTETLHEHY